jgi:membrane-anchored glycerophosphoryl diester phosphodiesterase (GDPDase)
MEDILDSQRSHDAAGGPSLEELKATGYTFDFGKYFATGWRAMKGDIGQFILFGFVGGLIWMISLFTVIGALLTYLPLMAGFLIYGRKALLDEPREFNDFFGGFKHFGPLVAYTLIILLVYVILGTPVALFSGISILGLTQITDNPEAATAAIAAAFAPLQIVATILSVIIQTLTFFAVPLIVLGKLGAVSAIRWSITLAKRNFFWILLYVFVVSLIQQMGVLACYVGIFFTVPLAQCLYLGAYAEIVGLGEKQES